MSVIDTYSDRGSDADTMDVFDSRKRPILDDAFIDQYRLVRPRMHGGGVEIIRSAAPLSPSLARMRGFDSSYPIKSPNTV